MSPTKRKGLPAPFFDFAMSVLLVFIALFFISTFEETAKNKAELPKAEFLIEMVWDNDSMDDVDLYVRDPVGNIVYFGHRDQPLLGLDVDNQGVNNLITMPDGTKKLVHERKEIVSIRAIVPGEYTINAHMYSKRDETPVGVKIRLIKVNPYKDVTTAEEQFDAKGQEKTLLNFTVNAQGEVDSMYVSPTKLVGNKKS